MLTSVVETPSYIAKASKIMSEAEMASVVSAIAADPEVGDVIRGTGGLRKARIPLQGRGKRGGGRVIYWYYNERFPAVLLWAFAKNDRADLSRTEVAALAKASEDLRTAFGSTR